MARGRFFIAQPGTWAVLLWLGVSGCAADSHSAINTDEALSGGETTTFETSRSAYSYPAANLEGARRDRFFVGNAVFNRTWVAAPSSTTGLDGLGPTFNATSCDACHFKDGRGAPPEGDDPFLGLLIRLSIPGEGAHGGPNPEPRYGEQFNHHAVLDVPAEGSAQVDYDEVAGAYADGAGWSLRAPLYRFDDLAFGPMDDEVMVSPRVANTMVGLGLLEAVPEETLVALEDPDDANADGVSGRANRVWDVERGTTVLGRFGWKANQPSLRQQIAGAFIGDIGITSSIFPNQNCPAPQLDCADAISGGEPELDGDKLEDVTYYASLLGVPARRDVDDPEVRKGKARFESFGCAACHTETLRTGDSDLFPELAHQTIHPYSDLLLHDMGEGLADGRPDFLADGREWRTPPLWGLGLLHTVNRHTFLLHDGRARDTEEAILWHGGEAEASRDAFVDANRADREALLRFLDSL